MSKRPKPRAKPRTKSKRRQSLKTKYPEKLSSSPSGRRGEESRVERIINDRKKIPRIVDSPSQNRRNENLASDKLLKRHKERGLLKQAIDTTKKNIWPPLSPTLEALRKTQLESDKERKKERREEQQRRKSYCEDGCTVSLRL